MVCQNHMDWRRRVAASVWHRIAEVEHRVDSAEAKNEDRQMSDTFFSLKTNNNIQQTGWMHMLIIGEYCWYMLISTYINNIHPLSTYANSAIHWYNYSHQTLAKPWHLWRSRWSCRNDQTPSISFLNAALGQDEVTNDRQRFARKELRVDLHTKCNTTTSGLG